MVAGKKVSVLQRQDNATDNIAQGKFTFMQKHMG
jgi:hypothetical protein